MLKYSVNITWSDEDKGYIAIIPELNNLSAFGESYKEALKEAEIAAIAYLETLEDENMPIPTPQKISSFSGQTRLRMPRELHQKLTIEAQKQGVSLNSFMIYLLSGNYADYKASYEMFFDMLFEKLQISKHIIFGTAGSNSSSEETPHPAVAGAEQILKLSEASNDSNDNVGYATFR